MLIYCLITGYNPSVGNVYSYDKCDDCAYRVENIPESYPFVNYSPPERFANDGLCAFLPITFNYLLLGN